MNIILTSVLERIKEIGLRHPLAHRKRCHSTILFVMISVSGGLIGVALGVTLALLSPIWRASQRLSAEYPLYWHFCCCGFDIWDCTRTQSRQPRPHCIAALRIISKPSSYWNSKAYEEIHLPAHFCSTIVCCGTEHLHTWGMLSCGAESVAFVLKLRRLEERTSIGNSDTTRQIIFPSCVCWAIHLDQFTQMVYTRSPKRWLSKVLTATS